MTVSNTFSANTKIKSAAVNTNFNEVWSVDWTAWSPLITGGTIAGTGTYSKNNGLYCRMGNIVFIKGTIIWTAHTGSGTMNITGFPVTSLASNLSFYTLNIGYYTSLNLPASAVDLVIIMSQNNTTAGLYTGGDNIGAAAVSLDTAATIYFSGFYPVA